MDRGLPFPLAVMGLSLCLLLIFASPASSVVLRDMVSPSDAVVVDGPDEPVDLWRFLRSVKVYNRLKEAVAKDLQLAPTENRRYRKRGFGIAGLDNVDMITSTLDRSRSRTRNHRPHMSLKVDLNQLRALMAKAG